MSKKKTNDAPWSHKEAEAERHGEMYKLHKLSAKDITTTRSLKEISK